MEKIFNQVQRVGDFEGAIQAFVWNLTIVLKTETYCHEIWSKNFKQGFFLIEVSPGRVANIAAPLFHWFRLKRKF